MLFVFMNKIFAMITRNIALRINNNGEQLYKKFRVNLFSSFIIFLNLNDLYFFGSSKF